RHLASRVAPFWISVRRCACRALWRCPQRETGTATGPVAARWRVLVAWIECRRDRREVDRQTRRKWSRFSARARRRLSLVSRLRVLCDADRRRRLTISLRPGSCTLHRHRKTPGTGPDIGLDGDGRAARGLRAAAR